MNEPALAPVSDFPAAGSLWRLLRPVGSTAGRLASVALPPAVARLIEAGGDPNEPGVLPEGWRVEPIVRPGTSARS